MKLTLDDINRMVTSAEYHRFAETTTTVCCLKLGFGFTAIGSSACIDPNEFDAAIGRKLAYDDAIGKVWQIAGAVTAWRYNRGELKALEDAKRAADAAVAEQMPWLEYQHNGGVVVGLYGSSVQPSMVIMQNQEVQLGEAVRTAYAASGLTVDQWNALPQDDRETRIAAVIDKAPEPQAEAAEAAATPVDIDLTAGDTASPAQTGSPVEMDLEPATGLADNGIRATTQSTSTVIGSHDQEDPPSVLRGLMPPEMALGAAPVDDATGAPLVPHQPA